MKDNLLTPEHVAEYLGVHIVTLANWRMKPDKNGLPYVKLSPNQRGKIRYRREDVDHWLNERVCGAINQT